MPASVLKSTKPPIPIDGGDGSSPRGDDFYYKEHVKWIGLWLFLSAVIMLFAAFTSAVIIRRESGDWKPIYFPSFLLLNTMILIISSFTFEISKRKLRSLQEHGYHFWLGITVVLGFAFLGGQIYVWKLMEGQGYFLPTNPHASFFYLLTCLHGLHLLGGILWLVFLFFGTWQIKNFKSSLTSARLASTYWHFLTFLWIYLYCLLRIV
jgi:cytochrome c oxidase subunit 3